MHFISTRSKERVRAEEAILMGYPKDGGLFVPESFPIVSDEELSLMIEESYPERVARILGKFFDFGEDFLKRVCEEGYARFLGEDPLPIIRIDEGKYILELFHGPTCAKEDVSITLFPPIYEKCKELCQDKRDRLFLMATSGDAGKATTEIFKGYKGVKVAAFYPEENIGRLQRLCLCISDGDNLLVSGVQGTFEDCHNLVKSVFYSKELSEYLEEKNMAVSTLSSANIFRIIPDIACYFSAYLDLLSSDQIEKGEMVDFSVPAGNGCGLIAGYYAKKMGLPIRKILSCTNRNRAYYDFFKKGMIDGTRVFRHTMSPSMDVSLPTNLERFLFEGTDRNFEKTKERMLAIKEEETELLKEEERRKLAQDVFSGFAAEDETVDSIYEVFEEYGYPMDTHTGVAMAVCDKVLAKRDEKDKTKVIVLSVANFYKFPQESLYALAAGDVKDSFKGIKRLNLLTAAKPPKFLIDFRYKTPRFKQVLPQEEGKILAEIKDFLNGKVIASPPPPKR